MDVVDEGEDLIGAAVEEIEDSYTLSSSWEDLYPKYEDNDDGWNEIPEKNRDKVNRYKKSLRVKRVPESAFNSVKTMTDYARDLGDEMVEGFSYIYNSTEYLELTSAQRARILRYRLAPSIASSYDKVGGVAKKVLTDVLVDNGLVLVAPSPFVTPAKFRLKDMISRSVDIDINSGASTGWGTFEGGARNIVELAGRQVLLQSSELMNSLTGLPLRGIRFTQRVDACDYCKSVSGNGFDILSTSNGRQHLGFHDNCRCTVDLET